MGGVIRSYITQRRMRPGKRAPRPLTCEHKQDHQGPAHGRHRVAPLATSAIVTASGFLTWRATGQP